MPDSGIVDPSGELIGRIRDVLVDLDEGRIEYVCIELERSGRERPSEVVVPWSAVRAPATSDADWTIAAGKKILLDIAQPIGPTGT